MATSQAASTSDPFNWKFPTRDKLMSLSNINQNDDMCRVKTAPHCNRVRGHSTNLKTDDIEGARPKRLVQDKISRPEYIN